MGEKESQKEKEEEIMIKCFCCKKEIKPDTKFWRVKYNDEVGEKSVCSKCNHLGD